MIRSEHKGDVAAIRHVNEITFGSDREANLVDTLRDGGFVEVSIVAEIDGQIVGHIMFSRVMIFWKAGILESLSLAPMAVLPEFQRQGIGSALVEIGVEVCRKLPYTSILVLGHPEFYPRFGFSPVIACRLKCPFGSGEAWMALELVPGALEGVSGRVEYSSPFSVFE